MVTKVRKRKSQVDVAGQKLQTEWVDVNLLNTFYKNPRRGNIEKVAESLKAHGQIKPIGVNRGTKTGRPNEILFGNHTFRAAKEKLKWKQIWVTWFDVDDTKAKQLVVADNGTTDDAGYDEGLLVELLQDVHNVTGTLVGTTYTDDVLGALVKTTEDPNSNVESLEDAPDDDGSIFDFKNWVYFPSNAAYDIPELIPDMIPEDLPGPIDVWAGHELDLPRQEEHPEIWWLAMWHAGMRGVNWKQAIPFFYTEDFHFEPVFTDPSRNLKKILNLGISYCIMPNYSCNPGWPIATWVWAAYRSHFVARYWQEAGLMVIPDIQYGPEDVALDITLAGIPKGAGIVSAQIQNARGDQDYIRRAARLLKESEDRLEWDKIIIYGHTDADRVLDRADLSSDVIRVAARTARRREYLNSGATLNTQQVGGGGKKKRKIIKKKAAA